VLGEVRRRLLRIPLEHEFSIYEIGTRAYVEGWEEGLPSRSSPRIRGGPQASVGWRARPFGFAQDTGLLGRTGSGAPGRPPSPTVLLGRLRRAWPKLACACSERRPDSNLRPPA
jgi:hypothetical protein